MATTTTLPHLAAADIQVLDPYAYMAVIGKRMIHTGRRRSTEELFAQAGFQPGQQVLDIGCGVGTTALAMAHRYGLRVTAADISPLMRERAVANAWAGGVADRVA